VTSYITVPGSDDQTADPDARVPISGSPRIIPPSFLPLDLFVVLRDRSIAREGNAKVSLTTKNPHRVRARAALDPAVLVLAGAGSERLKACPALLLAGSRLCADSCRLVLEIVTGEARPRLPFEH
jgi:hypothetical protein